MIIFIQRNRPPLKETFSYYLFSCPFSSVTNAAISFKDALGQLWRIRGVSDAMFSSFIAYMSCSVF